MFGKIPLAAGWRVTWSELELPYGELSGDSREVQEAMVKHGRTSANSNALHIYVGFGRRSSPSLLPEAAPGHHLLDCRPSPFAEIPSPPQGVPGLRLPPDVPHHG